MCHVGEYFSFVVAVEPVDSAAVFVPADGSIGRDDRLVVYGDGVPSRWFNTLIERAVKQNIGSVQLVWWFVHGIAKKAA